MAYSNSVDLCNPRLEMCILLLFWSFYHINSSALSSNQDHIASYITKKRGTDWITQFGSQSYVQRKGAKGGQAQPCPRNPISRDSVMELTCCYTFAAAPPQLQPVRSCLNESRVCCRKHQSQLLPTQLPFFQLPQPTCTAMRGSRKGIENKVERDVHKQRNPGNSTFHLLAVIWKLPDARLEDMVNLWRCQIEGSAPNKHKTSLQKLRREQQ